MSSQVHQIRNEAYTFKQKDLKRYPKAWERFKDLFKKCQNLDISKQAQVFIFYNGLHLEYKNLINASVDGSVMKIDFDEAREFIIV